MRRGMLVPVGAQRDGPGITFRCLRCLTTLGLGYPQRTFVAIRENTGPWVVQSDATVVHRCPDAAENVSVPNDIAEIDQLAMPLPSQSLLEYQCPGCAEPLDISDAFRLVLLDRNLGGSWLTQVDDTVVHTCGRSGGGPIRAPLIAQPFSPAPGSHRDLQPRLD